MKRGFTLIEVVVSLLITAIVALTAQTLLAAVIDTTSILRRSSAEHHGPVASGNWALESCRTLDPAASGFQGTPTLARFQSRLPAPSGWVERVPVSIAAAGRSVRLEAPGITAIISDSIDSAVIDYLADPAGSGGWVTGWSSPGSAPLAIRLRWVRGTEVDTLLCPIGARG